MMKCIEMNARNPSPGRMSCVWFAVLQSWAGRESSKCDVSEAVAV